MKFRILTCITAMTLLAALVVPVRLAAQDPPRYTVTDLGTLGGTFSIAYGVSNTGWVKGYATLPRDRAERAVLWGIGVKTDLGTLGGRNSFAYGTVNDSGDAVGASETSTKDPLREDYCGFSTGTNLTCLPFFWRSDIQEMIALPTLGGNNGFASGINDLGEMAGQAENATMDPTCPYPALQNLPVIWIKGQVQELPMFPGDESGAAWAINDRGQVAGNSGNCTEQSHALLWQHGTAIDLGNLGGTTNNLVFGINNRAQVVGSSDLPGDTTYDAFLWQKTTGMIDLGTLSGDFGSEGDGINNKGQVAGGSWDINDNERAFLWKNGVMTDLNTLIPPDSPLYLLEAYGINDSGLIVGLAYQISTGDFHAFLAAPTREYWAISERPKVVLPENARKQLQQRLRIGGPRSRWGQPDRIPGPGTGPTN